MSVDYDAELMAGFIIDLPSLVKALGKKVKERSHMEERWDPTTGLQVEPVKVVDQEAGIAIMLDGKEVKVLTRDNEVPFAALEAVTKKLGRGITYLYNEMDDQFAVGVWFRTSRVTPDRLAKVWPKLRSTQISLTAMGIKVKRPEVFSWLSIS